MKNCYYCGFPVKKDREHAPPQMMFKDFDCDSLIIPDLPPVIVLPPELES